MCLGASIERRDTFHIWYFAVLALAVLAMGWRADAKGDL